MAILVSLIEEGGQVDRVWPEARVATVTQTGALTLADENGGTVAGFVAWESFRRLDDEQLAELDLEG